MKPKSIRLCSRAAVVLLMMLLTATTAWAGNVTVTNETTAWTDGNTYNVTSDVTIDTRITVTGTVTLNLGAGATLTASKGIEVSQGNTLTIEGNGTLNATGAEVSHSNWTKKYRSGIGADAVGTIIINGGTINATGAFWAAGIGGDSYNSNGGSITINGGRVTATGNGGGAGIGGGLNGAAAGTIVINGGQVTAIAQAGGAAIGSGDQGATGGSLTLGWTNVHTDFIEAKPNYAYPFDGLSSISFADGKLFLLNGTDTQATLENINQAGTDVKLVPTKEIVNLSNATISGVDTHYEYTGNNITITPTVTLLSETLAVTDDYTISFKRNGTETTAVNEEGTYTLTVSGVGFYTGSIDVTFYVNAPVDYQAYENGAMADKALAYNEYVRVSAATTAMTAGWYVVAEDATVANRITTSGDVNLVLCNGATLTAEKGISVTDGNSLTIYGQDGNTGKLTASIPDSYGNMYNSAIGGDRYNTISNTGTPVKAGSITIHGGEITATSDFESAGIGKAYEGAAGSITIYGGKVTATCIMDGTGIGGTGATITLGYTTASDFIQSSGYSGTVTIMSGRIFVTDDTPAVDVSGNVSDNATINGKKLTPKTYTVSFNLNGADGSIASQTTYHGLTKAVEPEAPTRMGYTFVEWQLSGSAYDFSTAVTSDIELTAEWRKNALVDGETYTLTADETVPEATYVKTIAEERVGKHQAWFVPFNYTITSDDLEKFSFYKINMIANAPNPETNATDDIWVFLKKMDAGDVLHANMPYVYRAKSAVENYEFTTTNGTLKAKTTDARITMMTAEDTYTLYGTYENTTATSVDPFYYVNIDGNLSLGNDGSVTVGAYRWILRVESKSGSTPVYAREVHFFDGEDSETTGIKTIHASQLKGAVIYTLDGRRIAQPTKSGLYIVNGQKVVIK